MVEWKKLGEVCEFQNGFAFKSNLFKAYGNPIIRITNITSNNVDMTDCKFFDIHDYSKYNLSSFEVTSEDILLAMSGATTGKIGLYKGQHKAYINQRVGKFIPHTKALSNGYLYHYLLSKTVDLYIMAGGGAQPNLSSNKLMEELLIPIPSLEEQTRIVGILDTFTSAIDNLKEQIALRRKQYEYYRDQLLDLEGKPGVEMKEMWEVTAWDKRFQGVDKSMQSRIIPYTYLLAKDLFALAVPNGNIKLLSTGVQEGWTTEKLAGDYLSEGEVVTIPWGKSPGAQNPVKYYNGKFVTGDNRIATSLDTNVLDNKFLYYWMYSKSDIIETFYRGAGIQHPSMFKILTMKVSIPHISEQQRIVSILDTFEASIQNLEVQLSQREKQYEYYRNKLLTFD